MNTQNGFQLEQVIKKTQDIANKIYLKLEKLCQRMNLTKNTLQTLMFMKGRFGTLITQIVFQIYPRLILQKWTYLQGSMSDIKTRLRSV